MVTGTLEQQRLQLSHNKQYENSTRKISNISNKNIILNVIFSWNIQRSNNSVHPSKQQ